MTSPTNGNGPAAKPHNGTGKPKPARLPIGSFYARIDKRGRRYLSGRLGLMRVMIFETEAISEGDRVWEGVLVEGPHVSQDQRALAAQVEEAHP
jgi:hypothetical protein